MLHRALMFFSIPHRTKRKQKQWQNRVRVGAYRVMLTFWKIEIQNHLSPMLSSGHKME